MAVNDIIGMQTVDLSNDTNYCFAIAPQGDSQSRYVDITVLNNGVKYDIPLRSTVSLQGRNAGGDNIFINCTLLDKNTIRVPLNQGVLAHNGHGEYYIVIMYEGDYIHSFPFTIVAVGVPYDIDKLQTTDVYTALNEAVAKALYVHKWITGRGNPTTLGIEGDNGDYYLNTADGTLWEMKVTEQDTLQWEPQMDKTVTPNKQMAIMERIYIRYSDSADSGPMYTDPIDNTTTPPTVRDYIGFYVTTDTPNDASINVRNNYTWCLFRTDVTAVNTEYAKSNTYSVHPTTGWSSAIPKITDNDYLWTKIILTLKNGKTFSYYTVTQYGKPAGFGVPTSAITESIGKPEITITAKADSPNTDKVFDFDFKVRGGHWKTGNLISGNGTQVVTALNSSNTVVGDMYLNDNVSSPSYRRSYRCTAVTDTNSTWDESIVFDTVGSSEDRNSIRIYTEILPGQTSAVLTSNDPMFIKADADSSTADYQIRYLSSVPNLDFKSSVEIDDNLGKFTITKINTDKKITFCVEVTKKHR